MLTLLFFLLKKVCKVLISNSELYFLPLGIQNFSLLRRIIVLSESVKTLKILVTYDIFIEKY